MLKPNTVRSSHVVVVLAAAAALLVSACSSSGGHPGKTVTVTNANGQTTTATSAGATSSSAKPTPTAKPAKPVHISLLNSDGSTYGVGMPVIAFFSKKITDGKPLQQKTTATVNGKAVHGAWYFEGSSAGHGPIEAHFRLQNYWPAHARIHIGMPMKGVSAGKGLAYNDSLTLDFSTGPRNVSTVDDSSHRMTVTSDGRTYGTFPVSLGYQKTPTKSGTKVIMEKGRDISMRGPGYFDAHVKFTQRLTYDGEYLHSAPWNVGNIGHTDTS
ncbi:MAG: L,D-transpeptidase, partial [Nocardioidaceae bacterium]